MAGLIPQTFIDELLHRVDIVDVIDKRVSLKKSGKNYSACCPFHNEKSPSFSVQPEKQFYYCFGCGIGGNALGFVMEFDQLSFPEAVEALARDAGVEVPREESKAAALKHSEHAKLLDCVELTAKFYQTQIRQHEGRQAAIDYLKSRGVSGEIARDFGIGYAPPGWDNLLGELGKDVEAQQALFKAGLIIGKDAKHKSASKKTVGETEEVVEKDTNERHYYDRFRHRIMFPIRDSRGRSIAFGGRVLGDDKPKYLNSPETPIFHKGGELYGLYEAKKSRSKLTRILVVEGYMDVIALAQMGIRNAVATLGTATSTDHLRRIFKLVSEVVFCFDGDEAGRKAAWRGLETTLPLMEDGRQVKFLFLPEGEDPDTLVRKIGESEFTSQVESATPLENFFFDKLSQDLDINSIEGKARLSNLAKPLIQKFPKGIYAQLMLDRLSQTLGVASDSLTELMGSAPPPANMDDYPPMPDDVPPDMPGYEQSSASHGYSERYNQPIRPKRPAPTPRVRGVYRKPASLKAVELLIRQPKLALTIDKDVELLGLEQDEGRKLLLSLIELVKAEPDTQTATMLGYCYDSSVASQLTHFLKGEKITPTDGEEREFLQIVDNILLDIQKKLEKQQLKDKLRERFEGSDSESL